MESINEFWQQGAARALADFDLSASVREVAAALASGTTPLEIGRAIEIDSFKEQSAADLLITLIEAALSDHALSETEVRDLAHLQRVLRIDEGDLLKIRPHAVEAILAQEMQRLLEDERIDPQESLHKVELQRLLGLSYDEFLYLAAPSVDRLVASLAERIPQDGSEQEVRDGMKRFRRQLLALDSVFHVRTSNPRAGYLYLLANPAMPGLLKVGRTSRTPDERMAELSSATGVPLPFELIYFISVLDSFEAERSAHEWLGSQGYRVSSNREFYAVPIHEMIQWMTRYERTLH